MTVIKKTIVVPFTATQIYDLVNDLEKYPDFVSGCKEVTIHDKTSYKTKASVRAAKLGFDFTFTLQYQLEPSNQIKIFLMNKGPFQSIEGLWRFQASTDIVGQSQFGFELQFETTNRLFSWTITPLIKIEISNLLKEFRTRAESLYS